MAEHDLQAVAFPTLDEAQVATLGSCAGASLTKYRAGQTLFRCGDRDAKFFIVKSGQVEIRDETGDAPRSSSFTSPANSPARLRSSRADRRSSQPSPRPIVKSTRCRPKPFATS